MEPRRKGESPDRWCCKTEQTGSKQISARHISHADGRSAGRNITAMRAATRACRLFLGEIAAG